MGQVSEKHYSGIIIIKQFLALKPLQYKRTPVGPKASQTSGQSVNDCCIHDNSISAGRIYSTAERIAIVYLNPKKGDFNFY